MKEEKPPVFDLERGEWVGGPPSSGKKKSKSQKAERPGKRPKQSGQTGKREPGDEPRRGKREKFEKSSSGKRFSAPKEPSDGTMRLNQYIAHAGVCSRREADKIIPTGAIKVNGEVVKEMGFKVKPGDVVLMNGEKLSTEVKQYIVLNKPKGYITTTDDPQERKTVMDIVKNACSERIYPVGRLDRNTTGVLLLTNDGEMAKRLTHPSHKVKKVYHVLLDKNLTKNDMQQIADGMELEDGFIRADAIAYAGDGEDKREIGLEIHSGRNRIVRRIFEKLGYEIVKLDRVMFAGITKKDTPRGKWRHLGKTEVNILKRVK